MTSYFLNNLKILTSCNSIYKLFFILLYKSNNKADLSLLVGS